MLFTKKKKKKSLKSRLYKTERKVALLNSYRERYHCYTATQQSWGSTLTQERRSRMDERILPLAFEPNSGAFF